MQNEVKDKLKLLRPESAVSSLTLPCELCNALLKQPSNLPAQCKGGQKLAEHTTKLQADQNSFQAHSTASGHAADAISICKLLNAEQTFKAQEQLKWYQKAANHKAADCP